MTLRITLMSGEVEDFAHEYKIDANATFADLHRLILTSCGYEELPGQRFFICDDNWHPRTRILLTDEENVNIDEDVLLMEDTDLGDHLEDEGQRLAYRFDPESRRMFLMELTETSFGQPAPEGGKLCRRVGQPPVQLLQGEEPMANTQASVSEELGEEFYGEDGFNEGDLDQEGFDILDE